MLTTYSNFDRKIVPNFVFLIIIITSLVALILGIIGAEKALDGTNFKPNALIKAAMGTFLFLYFCLVSLVVVFGIHYKSYTDKVHRRAYKAMAFATPFLGVKQLYAALGDYSHDPVFSTFGGNTTVYLLLNVLMEMFATGIILGFGLTFGKPPVSPKPTADIEAQKEEQTKSPRLSYIPAEALQFGARFSRALAPWAHGDQYSNRASSIYPQDGESKDLPPLPSFPTIFSPYPQRDCSTPEDRYAVGKDGSVSVRNQRRSLLRAGTSSSQRFPVVAKQESPEMVHASPSLRQRYPNGVAVGGQTRMWREQTIPPPEYRREQSTEDMYGLRQEWREQQGGWREEGGEERIDWAPAGVEPRYF